MNAVSKLRVDTAEETGLEDFYYFCCRQLEFILMKIHFYFVHLIHSYKYSNFHCKKSIYKYTNLQAYYNPKFLRQNQHNDSR